MNKPLLLAAACCVPAALPAQAALNLVLPPGTTAPDLAQTRAEMSIPSAGDLRGQRDTLGFASKAEQMARVWELSTAAPAPERLGPKPEPGVAGIICPHDDYLCAGRVYREIIPLVKAKVVVMVGVFHRYKRYGARGVMVFDPYRAWRSPDGEIAVSDLREAVLAQLDPRDYVQDATYHDSEHSLEGVAYWLKHQDPDVTILPVILPSAPFQRLQSMAGNLGKALAKAMQARGWTLGRDVAVVISSDGTHYGADFGYTPYGAGGVDAFQAAMAHDRALLQGLLAGEVTPNMARAFFEMTVDPGAPDTYRKPWCGRFSIPFGLLLLGTLSQELGLAPPKGMPIAFGASVDVPELPLRSTGLGQTCPISLYHFVTFPSVAFVN